MEETITYVGLDVHKKSISVAVAEGGRRGEARFFGTIPNKAAGLTKLAERLSHKGGSLRFCYEAGPCGYGVYRHLRGLGHACAVVAPSLIPRRAGDRVRTDRRDALPPFIATVAIVASAAPECKAKRDIIPDFPDGLCV